LLLTDSSGGIDVLALFALFMCLSILRWYIYRQDQDLAI
jgi:cbb3-type cytochrome oxidase subunit 3